MVIGSIVSWLASFLLYGFGQLVQNTDYLVQIGMGMEPNINDAAVNRNSGCPECGNPLNGRFCMKCGYDTEIKR